MKARLRAALRWSLLHLLLSLGVALLAAALVFGVWYPAPLHELAGGAGLFLILTGVDVVCGPVLTLVLYDPAKPKAKWRVDMALIALVQLGALAYGLSQVAAARPVFLALEGNRFRVVQAMDVDASRLGEAPEGLRTMGWTGPQLLAARLVQPGEPGYLASVQLSAQGVHPAFRPARWMPYENALPVLRQQLLPVATLRQKNPQRVAELDQALARLGQPEAELGYLPLVRDEITDWVVLVQRSDGAHRAYLHLDGW